MNNNKNNLKRSLKNKQKNRNVQLIGIDENEAKKKEKIERDNNMTYSKEKKENIVVKSYKNKSLKTKNPKKDFHQRKKKK